MAFCHAPDNAQRALRQANRAQSWPCNPLVVGDRVFTLGGTAVLSAWNAQTGALAWRKDAIKHQSANLCYLRPAFSKGIWISKPARKQKVMSGMKVG